MSLDARLELQLGSLALAVDLVAEPGTVTAVLGPNGAGKTTILRLLAGLEALDGGHLRLGERVLDDPATRTFVPTEARRVGFVHQDLLLFPHLSVLDNVAFGPRSAGASRRDARAKAAPWLEQVGLTDYAAGRPSDLSGGQAQRVALARALAAEPDLLLLDEPLSALDVATRGTTRRDLRRHLDGFAGTTVVVTHDPLDALTLAGEVLVLEAGAVTQAGPLAEVTARPRTRYVADLLGTNLLAGTATGHTLSVPFPAGDAADDAGGAAVEVTLAEAATGPTFALVAPSAVALHRARPEGSARNAWPVTVAGIDLLGERARVHLDGPVALVAEVTPGALVDLGLQVGSSLWAAVKATEVTTYPR